MMGTLPVGLQLYSIRDVLEESPQEFKKIMLQLRDFGYSGVELAGLYGLEPAAVRDTLQEVGLTPISAHMPLIEMLEDVERAAKDYSIIGCKYIVVPYLPEQYRHQTPGYKTILSAMGRMGKSLREYGITLLYHNHDFEFVRLEDGVYGLDDIYRQVPAELLQAEPDTCWIKVAGEDPGAYIKKYKGRVPIVHLKDFVKEGTPQNLYKLIGIEGEQNDDDSGFFRFCPVGFGQQVWQPILEASVEAGAEWVVVEQDEHYELPALEAARCSREYLKLLGW